MAIRVDFIKNGKTELTSYWWGSDFYIRCVEDCYYLFSFPYKTRKMTYINKFYDVEKLKAFIEQ